MVLFTIALTNAGVVPRSLQKRAVILIEPVPAPVRLVAAPVRAKKAPELARVPRLFSPAVGLASPVIVALVSAPAIDIARPVLPAVELRNIAAVPAPPLKIDNLRAAWVETQAPAQAEVQMAGFAAAHSDGPRQVAALLRPSGFSDASTADEAGAHATVLPLLHAGFGDAVVLAGGGARVPVGAGDTTARGVEILSKPRPAYTDEARRLQIEGEVLLEILFSASGQVRVLRTVRGLGHGLDETAIAAAEAIRFRPAERGRVSADSTAIVHLVFQLAY
jgi:TonB family protein